MITIRRLDPVADEALFRQAFSWENENLPRWYTEAHNVWGVDTWEEYLERTRRDTQIDTGVFTEDGAFVGLVTVIRERPGIWEAHLSGATHGKPDYLAMGAMMTAHSLFQAGVATAFISWVMSRHHGAARVNEIAGMKRTGITLLKGQVRNRLIEWQLWMMTQADLIAWSGNGQEEEANTNTAAADNAIRLQPDSGFAGHPGGTGMATAA